MRGTDWSRIKRGQAHEADRVAATASGIGQFGISNACYALASILRRQAAGEAPDQVTVRGSDPDLAIRLLQDAFFLRQNGENAPGGTETWREWDGRCEAFLRSLLPAQRHGLPDPARP